MGRGGSEEGTEDGEGEEEQVVSGEWGEGRGGSEEGTEDGEGEEEQVVSGERGEGEVRRGRRTGRGRRSRW